MTERTIVLNPYELGALLGTFKLLPALPVASRYPDQVEPGFNEGVVPAYTDEAILERARLLAHGEVETRRESLMAKGAELLLNRIENGHIPTGTHTDIPGIHPADQLAAQKAAQARQLSDTAVNALIA